MAIASENPDEGIERILIVAAHPDDVDFGCAGSTAKWTNAGIRVSYCIATDGDAGGFDESITRTEMATIRRREQTNAGTEVGVTDIHWLGYPDGKLYPTIELRRDITRVIRQVLPDRVVTQSPDRNWDRIYASHPDHLAAGEATVCAVYPDARNQFAHRELLDNEGLQPHTVRQLYLMALNDPTIATDITETFDRKLAALQCHVSQVSHRDPAEMEQMLRGWAGGIAQHMGLPDGHLAEAFRRVNTE